MAEGDGPQIQSGQTGDGKDNARQKGSADTVNPSVVNQTAEAPARPTTAPGLPDTKVDTTFAKTAKAESPVAGADAKVASTEKKATDSSKPSEESMKLAKQMELARAELQKLKEDMNKAGQAFLTLAEKLTGKDAKSLQSNPAAAVSEILQRVKSGNIPPGLMSAVQQVPDLVSRYAPLAQKHIDTMSGLLASTESAKSLAEKEQPAAIMANLKKMS